MITDESSRVTPDEVLEFFAELQRSADRANLPVDTYRYGSHPEQRADLRLPEGVNRPPVVVLFHGGFWRAISNLHRMDALAVDLTRRGWATWNVEYRRTGSGGGIPATLEDAEVALRQLHALNVRLDLTRVVALGHSVGGHLALWVAASGLVTSTVALGALSDLADSADGVGRLDVAAFAGGSPEALPGVYAAADPAHRLPAHLPHLIVHGAADQRVPVAQSLRYAERVAASGDPCELVVLPGVDHFSPVDPQTQAWAEVAGRLERIRDPA